MRSTSRALGVALGVAVALALAAAGVVDAQVKKGKTRPLATAQLMKGVVKPNCDALKKGLDAGSTAEEAWQALLANAALINEASFVLMDDGRCPDGTWAEAASKTLRQGSADLVEAIEKHDAAAAKTAFGAMTRACKSCHDAHRKKQP